MANPSLYYKLDEIAGTVGAGTVIDSSGNARHGTPVNGTVFGATGKVGKAAQFDGANDYIQGPVLSSGQWTWSLWFNPSTVSATNFMLMSDQSGQSGRHLFYNATSIVGQVGDGVGFAGPQSANGLIAQGAWNHVVMTYDGSIRLYVNGQLVAGPTARSYAASGSAINVGIMGDGVNFPFFGMIDEVKVFNAALNAGDVAALYRGGLVGNGGSFDLGIGIGL